MKTHSYHRQSFALLGCGCLLMLALAGCTGNRAQTPPEAKKFLLGAEPAGALTIGEATEQAEEKPNVVFVGRLLPDHLDVGGEKSGVLLLTELPEEGHGHKSAEEADNCPFCKRREAKAPRAMVQFLDSTGQPLAIDPQKAFDISKGDAIVVRGRAEMQPEEKTLIVTAEGIFVRK